MSDIIETIGKSVIHHGKNSNRIYVMSLHEDDVPHIIEQLEGMASTHGYTKIVVKGLVESMDTFLLNGYKTEAIIPKFYYGEKSGCFVSKFMENDRKNDLNIKNCNEILKNAIKKDTVPCSCCLEENFECRKMTKKDIPAMVHVYKDVFLSYPFPIFEEEYIWKTMQENLIYFGILKENQLVAISSIELDQVHSYAEMTDFAVRKEFRGNGFAHYLLVKMEEELKKLEIKTAFTIARAKSSGINITFSKNDYTYSGTLVNNTNIAGQIESMNVWYKHMM